MRRSRAIVLVSATVFAAALTGAAGSPAAGPCPPSHTRGTPEYGFRCGDNGRPYAQSGTLSNGISWFSNWYGYDIHRRSLFELNLRGQPKVRGDYVATTYNVRLLPGGVQTEHSANSKFQMTLRSVDKVTVAVQGCRYRLVWLRSYCGAWATFQVNGALRDDAFP